MEILTIIATILIFVFVFASVRVVPEDAEYRLVRLGRPLQILRPGLHVIVPFVDRIEPKIPGPGSADDPRA